MREVGDGHEAGLGDGRAGLGQDVEVVDGDPCALIVAVRDLVVGPDAHAIGGAHAGGDDVEARTVGRQAEDAAMVGAQGAPAAASRVHRAALEEVEVAAGVHLEVEGELVEVGRDLHVVVHVLIRVRLAVAVEVAQAGDLVPSEDMDDTLDHLEPERVEEAGGIALPADGAVLRGQVGAHPDVAAPGGEGEAVAFEEIQRAEAHPRAVRVRLRHGQGVDEVGRDLELADTGGVGLGSATKTGQRLLGLGLAHLPADLDGLLPARGPALGEGEQVGGRRGGGLGGGGQGGGALGERGAHVGHADLGADLQAAKVERERAGGTETVARDARDGDGDDVGAAMGKQDGRTGAGELGPGAGDGVGELDPGGQGAVRHLELAHQHLTPVDHPEIGRLEDGRRPDRVGEDDALAVEEEAAILGVGGGKGAERTPRVAGVGRLDLAGLGEAALGTPAGSGIGLVEDRGVLGGARVGAVLGVEGDAAEGEPAAGPGAGHAEGVGVEGGGRLAPAMADDHGLVGRGALTLVGILAAGVLDRGGQERTVVHRLMAGRLLGREGEGREQQGNEAAHGHREKEPVRVSSPWMPSARPRFPA